MEQKDFNTEDKLQQIISIERQLGEIQDVDVLLERILTETRKIVHADAGSIYVVEGNRIRIKYGQNDTHLRELAPGEKLPYTNFTFAMDERSICGYVASTGLPLNIDDAYNIPENKPYKFSKNTDLLTDYRTKSIYTLPLKMANGKLLGVLQIINALDENGNVTHFDEQAELLISHFASSAVQALQHAYLTSNMVKRMLKMAEFRDPKETYPHVERVSSYSLEIYDRWAFNHNIAETEKLKFRDALKIASKFHDVGKVGISDVILKKTFPRFTDEERNIMKGHTCIGAQLFDPPESFLDQMSQEIALHHHDRWDGDPTGYPGNISLSDFDIRVGSVPSFKPLAGKEIPLSARIVAVADVFDALSHKRCYKDSWSIEESFAEIQDNAGTHFDPEIVLAFMQVKDRICSIQMAFPDEAES
ncbi:MAG: GAF domain-containing protein [Treponema sp.]|nr:GAF domain-containing protein [Treponema sp.]